MRVSINQSKTDPSRKGIHLFLEKTFADLCPVTALLNYLVLRGIKGGPSFIFKDGCYLTWLRLMDALWEALQKAGIGQSKYSGHSFRIETATTAAVNGLEDSIITTLGRRRSIAYLCYMQIPWDELANYSRMLCT